MLELKNICYSVAGKDILKDVSLTLNNNINVITGPNGAGKSTLAKIIMGIVPATSGQILFNGKDITTLSITERANLGFSFAFQQPVKFKGIKVFDLLKLAGKDKEIALSTYLNSVGLCSRDYMQRELGDKLSGGELKRIEIASVLAKNGCVNIFDEPEAGIDIWSFNHLIETFTNFQNKNKGCFIMISHQQKMIELANNVILLENGKLKMHGSFDVVSPYFDKTIKNCNGCEVNNG